MKYCTKCGNQMEDKLNFCQKCGKAVNSAPTEQPASPPPPPSVQASSSVYPPPAPLQQPHAQAPLQQPPMSHYQQAPRHNADNNKPRTGMKVAAIIFLCFGCLWILMGIIGRSVGFGIAFSMPFFAVALIFFLYYKTPKASAEGKFYIRGKATLPKVITIIAIMMVSLVSCSVVFGGIVSQTGTSQTSRAGDNSASAGASSPPNASIQETIPTDDIDGIVKWYENNADAIVAAVIDFIPAQIVEAGVSTNISGIEITETSFEFSELLGCAYYIYFDCVVDGVPCHGHTSAFVEYLGNDIAWIDFEVSTDADWAVLVEWFDDEAEAKSYDYYNTLIEMYGK